jgi:hypothetical protein
MLEQDDKNWRQLCSAAPEAKYPDELLEIVQKLNSVPEREERFDRDPQKNRIDKISKAKAKAKGGGAMLHTDAPERRVTPRWIRGPELTAVRRTLRIEPNSRRFILFAALGVGIVSFLATELMHYLLVPDIGPHPERLLAEGLSAFVVSCLVAKLVHISRERHRLVRARMQVIAEMNHHIRNALSPVALSLDATDNQPLNRVIVEAVDRIDWALREILPRELPLGEGQRDQLGYFSSRRSKVQ